MIRLLLKYINSIAAGIQISSELGRVSSFGVASLFDVVSQASWTLSAWSWA
jgi:hypothetical protein